MEPLWNTLLNVLILLLAAMVLGALFERLKQSAILGYLLAGTLVGPNALNWVTGESTDVAAMAELGVSLLLFTIGLEFSWRRLRSMGAVALGGGVLQLIITIVVATIIAKIFGLTMPAAIVIGAAIALSSTACVLRVLVSRADIESMHGRFSVGILLVQDMAVVPLVLLVSVLASGSGPATITIEIGRTILLAGGLFSAFYLLLNYVVPFALDTATMSRNRELPILLAIVIGLGSAWAAHRLGLSPALGAFAAGLLLAESPYATQIRADIASIRTLLLTLFFASIGMLGNISWIADHWALVLAVVAGSIIGKTLIVWLVLRLMGRTHRNALAAGLCLAQIGEFSFVLATQARLAGGPDTAALIDDDLFRLLVSTAIATLFVTPYLVGAAPRIAGAVVGVLERAKLVKSLPLVPMHDTLVLQDHVILIGFGPAGQAVGETLTEEQALVAIIDLNRRAVTTARRRGFLAHVGDARKAEVLEHVQVARARAVVVTIPDPASVRHIVALIRTLGPDVPIIARARYHAYRWELQVAGAHVVVDEEQTVGERLAAELEEYLEGDGATKAERDAKTKETEAKTELDAGK